MSWITDVEWGDFGLIFYTHTHGITGGFRLAVWGLLFPNRSYMKGPYKLQ